MKFSPPFDDLVYQDKKIFTVRRSPKDEPFIINGSTYVPIVFHSLPAPYFLQLCYLSHYRYDLFGFDSSDEMNAFYVDYFNDNDFAYIHLLQKVSK